MKLRVAFVTVWFLILSASGFAAELNQHGEKQSEATTEKSTGKRVEVPAPIPLSEVAIQLETRSAQLQDVEASISSNDASNSVNAQLNRMLREIDARAVEQNKILAQRPSLEVLRSLERGWQRLDETFSRWTNDLAKSITTLTENGAYLANEEKTWLLTREQAKEDAPPEVELRISAMLKELARLQTSLDTKRTQLLALHNRVTLQSARVKQALLAVKVRRDETVDRVFNQDSPLLWSAALFSLANASIQRDAINSLTAQFTTLGSYARQEIGRFLLHISLFVFLTFVLWWLKRRSHTPAENDPTLTRAQLIFSMPVATALVLAGYASMWVYPQAPRLLWTSVGLLVLIPTILILQRLLPRLLVPALYAIVFFYTVDQIRAIFASLEAVPRIIFVGEMLGGIAFLIWFISSLRSSRDQLIMTSIQKKSLRAVTWCALMFCIVTGVANTLGYVTLSNLLGNAILSSAYYGVILVAIVIILDGIVAIALTSRPLVLSKMVQVHAALLGRRIGLFIRAGAIIILALFFLDRLALRDRISDAVIAVFTSELKLGSIAISLGDILMFVITVWASFAVSRFIQFLLKEDIYPRAHLARGLPYAISRALHYTILVSGFLLAVAALGFDMTKFTILAGAFTVGVGFGLQNIFNNFVSGIILLFERPVQVGDLIQIDDISGTVDRIGIRASIIRASNGSEIIVPNGKLISERLVNWTFSNQQRSVEVPISVGHGADPKQVIQLINEAATSLPQISKQKPPQTLLTRMGPDWLGFELRAWTDNAENWTELRSDLAIAMSETLANAKIALK